MNGDRPTATAEQGKEIFETLAASRVQVLTEPHALRWVVRTESAWERDRRIGFFQTAAGLAAPA
ncbi:hypothetical protein [Xylophilus ampelinus]|uniref:Uncharacterized protein n=1 Tax=Xylophilus ampelinus TaxID=54067 RepID=A0A318SDU1_9BURK|nr:hypothetical protein [Xylophilus ampelinus]PYE75067.1 hypothetical protein DFQ15_12020 [Xylophilus ampelinus]